MAFQCSFFQTGKCLYDAHNCRYILLEVHHSMKLSKIDKRSNWDTWVYILNQETYVYWKPPRPISRLQKFTFKSSGHWMGWGIFCLLNGQWYSKSPIDLTVLDALRLMYVWHGLMRQCSRHRLGVLISQRYWPKTYQEYQEYFGYDCLVKGVQSVDFWLLLSFRHGKTLFEFQRLYKRTFQTGLVQNQHMSWCMWHLM